MTPIVLEKFRLYYHDLTNIKQDRNERKLLMAGYIDCLKDFGFITDADMIELYNGEV